MARTPGQIVYFGDSLTDDGNLLAFAQQLVDPEAIEGLAGPTGSASDGPTHAVYTRDRLGIPTQNYAVASAEVDGVQDLAFVAENFDLTDDLVVDPDDPILDTDINLNGQVGRFLEDNAGEDLSDTTAFVFIGSNDYNEVDLESDTVIRDVLAKMEAIIAGIIAEAERLADAGVDRILISTLPAADFYAGAALLDESDQALGNAVFSIQNLFLGLAVDRLAAEGVPVELFDIRQITDALTEDPTAFGLIAPQGTLLIDPDTLDSFDADQVFATDELHPSTAVHGVIGAFNAFAFSGGTTTKLSDRFDFHRGGDGADFVAGMGGTDIILGGLGDDVILGGTGNDTLSGQRGDDLLSGGSDDDLLRGGVGHDILGGGEGDDVLLGGAGRDLLVDGLGSDVARGSWGGDTFIYTEATLVGGSGGDLDHFDGGAGRDRLILVLGEDSYDTMADDLEGDAPADALAGFGISVSSIEVITAIDGRDGLDAFAWAPWYEDADIWGLI
ncbi:SGNH/GDSL hydrolase family protein [Marinibacterium profundimaris]|uniref:SGNH/GDSL hydrolase family protein n=1 Tax=Marinibacterium profundimaris TaxID=1679460 RepID=UPI000B5278BC|nr:SGNH/GDSL hydrolase family protein [Marinibacterium profundimaris]